MSELLSGGKDALASLKHQLDAVSQAKQELTRLRERGALLPLSSVRLDAPVQPRLIVCHGRAYRAHRKEMGIGHLPVGRPSGFIKNANAVTGPDSAIDLPPAAPDMVDFEGELAVVFHTYCHRVSADDAWDYVAGLTLSNDVSARNWVEMTLKTGNFALVHLSKQFPTFFPIGPCLATLDEFEDRNNIQMTTTVNGAVMQNCTTADLIWPAAELIAHYSTFYPFQPGDVMTLGTPDGVGYARSPKVFLAPGDKVAICSPAIGLLENTVRSVNPAAPPLGIVQSKEG
jgi:2-keto-4-pentenoate hydratase/2-oxohepta-3-ene-1,7-dioic acid hydratase in catechol pathway